MGSTARSEFRTVSKRARTLLDRTEGLESDFKQTPNAVESSDIVAFANSARGGTILVGVEETQDAQGIQRGRVIGCDVTDQTKQRILNRAASCVPPVPVQIYVENTSKTPFLRIDIPTSARRPTRSAVR